LTRKLSRKEIAEIGIYDFLGYIGAFNTPFIGGMDGTFNLLEKLQITEDSHVLEVGCATGFTSCMIAEKYGCSVTGIDLSEILVEKARERAEKQNLTNVRFEVANALNLPFEDDTFDAVFAVAVTALIPDKYAALKEYLRVVKPQGVIGTLDLFLRESAPTEARDKFNKIFMDILGSDNEIMNISEWRNLFGELGLNGAQIDENYNNVFEMPRNRSSATRATLKLVYHMIINGEVRRRVMKLMNMRNTVTLKSEGEYENVGYLIFKAIKPY